MTAKKIIHQVLPPFLKVALKKLVLKNKGGYTPAWHTVTGGILRGRQIFIDPGAGQWQKEMIGGLYDVFMFNYIKSLDLQGEAIYDIGAQIGYHALSFALLTGSQGMVYAFEPNRFNAERIAVNLSGNKDLAEHIRVCEMAVSDEIGSAQFHFSQDVESGASSGSFLSTADTYYPKTEAFLNSFKKMRVKTTSLDELCSTGTLKPPRLIKIDVEGSESRVLRGAVNLIRDHHPLLLIEVHSIHNMLQISEILHSLEYTIVLLKEEIDGRCFIAGSPLLKVCT